MTSELFPLHVATQIVLFDVLTALVFYLLLRGRSGRLGWAPGLVLAGWALPVVLLAQGGGLAQIVPNLVLAIVLPTAAGL